MLEIKDLSIEDNYKKELLNKINLKLNENQIIGITGSSGSGKTTIIKSILGMLNSDLKIAKGEIFLDNKNLNSLKRKERRNINGLVIGYIPQNPMTAFDRRYKIGQQIIENFTLRLKISKDEAKNLAEVNLKKVNLKDISRVMNSYPSELSGGMLQRVCVANILGLNPKYILADEITAALDEDNRNILIEIIKKDLSSKGILFISHDIEAFKKLSSKVIVLSNGKIIEEGDIKEILNNPKEKWTKEFAALNKFQDKEVWQWKDCL